MTTDDYSRFTHRLATTTDIPALTALMTSAIGELQRGFLTESQIAASRRLTGLDSSWSRMAPSCGYTVIGSLVDARGGEPAPLPRMGQEIV